MTVQHPANLRRAIFARAAVLAYASATGRTADKEEMHPDDFADLIADIIGDLGHYCDGVGLNFAELKRRGENNYEHEASPHYKGD